MAKKRPSSKTSSKQSKKKSKGFPWHYAIAIIALILLVGVGIEFILDLNRPGPGNTASQMSVITNPALAKRRNILIMGLAFHHFHSIYDCLPHGLPYRKEHPEWYHPDGTPKLSWRVHILPMLEQKELYAKFKLDEPWDSEHNIQLINEMPDVFKPIGYSLPSGETCYQIPAGPRMVFDNQKGKSFKEMLNGTFNAIYLVEVAETNSVKWTKPFDTSVPAEQFANYLRWENDHSNISYADGQYGTVYRNGNKTGAKGKVIDVSELPSDLWCD